jgi:hypothetical protein
MYTLQGYDLNYTSRIVREEYHILLWPTTERKPCPDMGGMRPCSDHLPLIVDALLTDIPDSLMLPLHNLPAFCRPLTRASLQYVRLAYREA